MKPLDERFFRSAIASGALVPPHSGPDRPLVTIRGLIVLALCCLAGLAYGVFIH